MMSKLERGGRGLGASRSTHGTNGSHIAGDDSMGALADACRARILVSTRRTASSLSAAWLTVGYPAEDALNPQLLALAEPFRFRSESRIGRSSARRGVEPDQEVPQVAGGAAGGDRCLHRGAVRRR